MEKIDLHIHSSYSDGSDDLELLLKNVQTAGLTTFALTDHDTIEGCKFMLDKIPQNIKFIPAIELTCVGDGIKCHMLGYNCNPFSKTLNDLIEKGKLLRRQKLETRIEFLRTKWGIELTEAELNWLYSRSSVVKTHLANILVKRGLATDNVSAMQKYLDSCKTGNTRFDTKEAIEVIKNSGGIPVWAHPLGGEGEIHLTPEEFLPKLKTMMSLGIEGLECYYSRYNKEEANFLADCANKNNLLITAGSDYHGTNKNGITIGKLSADNSFVPVHNITLLTRI